MPAYVAPASVSPLDEPPFARTSRPAIASFIFGALCCIPGLGSVAVLTGAFAVYAISQSKGSLEGRPLAIAGMVLGMLSLTVWVFLMWGAVVMVRMAQRNFIDPVVNTMLAIDRGDFDLARGFFAPGVSVTDEQFTAFRNAYRADAGEFIGFQNQTSLSGLLAQVRGQQPMPSTVVIPPSTIPFPLPYRFAKADAHILVAIPPGQDLRDTLYAMLFSNKTVQGQATNLIYQRDAANPVLLIPPKP